MLSRRDFMRASSLIALAPSVPAFLAQTVRAADPVRDSQVLVVIQLDGGNDGINTIVPFADEGYGRNRRQLRLPTDRVIKINDQVGFHPSMRDAATLLESGRLAVVQGVGYPNPNRSHDVSMAIWHTCRFDREEHKGLGWIGRALDSARDPTAVGGAPASLLVGRDPPPVAIRARRSTAAVMADLSDYALANAAPLAQKVGEADPADDLAAFARRSALDAYTTAERLNELAREKDSGTSYPITELARRLSLVSRLIKAGFETRVYYVVQPGYDTHLVQLETHAQLLEELSSGLRAFLDDLAASGEADRVTVLAFSEFGRRVEENASRGTDHGTAGPVLVAGPNVTPGLIGTTPALTDLDEGDLKAGVDFRNVYASIIQDWLGLRSEPALGGSFSPLKLVEGS